MGKIIHNGDDVLEEIDLEEDETPAIEEDGEGDEFIEEADEFEQVQHNPSVEAVISFFTLVILAIIAAAILTILFSLR